MILEIYQWIDLLNGKPHALCVFFLIYVLMPTLVIRFYSDRYKPYTAENKPDTSNVSIILPVLHEDYLILRKALISAYNQNPGEIILVFDGGDDREVEMAMKIPEVQDKLKVIRFNKRMGKKRAVIAGAKQAKNEFIITMDSDTIFSNPNTLAEMLIPMENPSVGSVSPMSHAYQIDSYLAHQLSMINEMCRNVVNKALDHHIVVAYGSCVLWRKEVMLSMQEGYLGLKMNGKLCEAGEDRCLTRLITKHGYSTAVQSTASIECASPSTMRAFIKQRLRWTRSGIMFFIQDIKEWHMPSKRYLYHCFMFYTAPVFFMASLLLDTFYFGNVSFTTIPIIMVLIGVTLIGLFRNAIKLKYYNITTAAVTGILGLFILFPLSLYAYCTTKKLEWVLER